MSYIGNPIVSTDFPVDYFSGNGSTTAFTLSIAPASVNSLDVQVSGVSQSPQTYTVSGTTLTFSAAPPTGSSNIVVRHLGIAGIPNTPSAASVVTASIADANVTQAKLATGVAGTGPAFSVYLTASQNVTTSVNTKIALNARVFDTASAFDITTNYRFTPLVTGYYQFNATLNPNGTTVSSNALWIFKNGAAYTRIGLTGSITSGSCLVYLNGSTDYIEFYGAVTAASAPQFYSDGTQTYTSFSGSLVRAA